MNRILAIGANTFKEAIRQKLLYGLIFFSVLIIFSSYFLGEISIFGAEVKIVKDTGLASIYLMGVFISLSMGISLVFKEIERKTIYTILSKPVSRIEFVLGKYFGLVFTVGVELFFMTCIMFLMLSTYKDAVDWNLWKAVILIYFELCILISVTLLFSSYSSSFMTSLFCFSFLIVGHVTDNLINVIFDKIRLLKREKELSDSGEFFMRASQKFFEIFNLDHFAINAKIVHGVPVPWSFVGYSAMYAGSFVFIFLLIANYVFSKKDLK